MTAPNWALDALQDREMEHLGSGIVRGATKPEGLSEAASVVWDSLIADAEIAWSKGYVIDVSSDPDFPDPAELRPLPWPDGRPGRPEYGAPNKRHRTRHRR